MDVQQLLNRFNRFLPVTDGNAGLIQNLLFENQDLFNDAESRRWVTSIYNLILASGRIKTDLNPSTDDPTKPTYVNWVRRYNNAISAIKTWAQDLGAALDRLPEQPIAANNQPYKVEAFQTIINNLELTAGIARQIVSDRREAGISGGRLPTYVQFITGGVGTSTQPAQPDRGTKRGGEGYDQGDRASTRARTETVSEGPVTASSTLMPSGPDRTVLETVVADERFPDTEEVIRTVVTPTSIERESFFNDLYSGKSTLRPRDRIAPGYASVVNFGESVPQATVGYYLNAFQGRALLMRWSGERSAYLTTVTEADAGDIAVVRQGYRRDRGIGLQNDAMEELSYADRISVANGTGDRDADRYFLAAGNVYGWGVLSRPDGQPYITHFPFASSQDAEADLNDVRINAGNQFAVSELTRAVALVDSPFGCPPTDLRNPYAFSVVTVPSASGAGRSLAGPAALMFLAVIVPWNTDLFESVITARGQVRRQTTYTQHLASIVPTFVQLVRSRVNRIVSTENTGFTLVGSYSRTCGYPLADNPTLGQIKNSDYSLGVSVFLYSASQWTEDAAAALFSASVNIDEQVSQLYAQILPALNTSTRR